MNHFLDTLERPATIATAFYEALLAGDMATARRHLADGVRLHVPGVHPLAGVHIGPDALLGFAAASRALTEHGETITVIDVLDGSNHAAVYCRVTATRADRRPLDNTTVHLLHIPDRLIEEVWLHNWDDFAVNRFWS